jgi:Cu(I)/Ag(I) efflux system membrane fusion protein
MNKHSFVALLIVRVLLLQFGVFPLLGDSSAASAEKAFEKKDPPVEKGYWTCSMDPQIHQDHPGECPICGMALVPYSSHQSSDPPQSFGAMPEQSLATVIHLDPLQSSSGNIRTSSVEEMMIHPRMELFGEISSVTDKQVDFTWYYGGRIQKTLVDYNTTEISEKTPLLEVYSDEAIADQRMYLDMLMHHWRLATNEQAKMEAQYGELANKVRPIGMSFEHKVNDGHLHAIEERLSLAGMTPKDFQQLQKTGNVRSTFVIQAPQSGTLLESLPHVGSRFDTDKVLFTLVPLKEVWFVTDIFEQDISLLKLGQDISISSKPYPGQLFHGKLVFIGRDVDPRKRTVKARFLVSNPNGLLLPQLSATGLLEVDGGKPQLAVPASAVIDTGRRQLVYVETSPGAFTLRTVKLGTEGDLADRGNKGEANPTRWVQILEGLTPGEKVVSCGAFLVDAEAQLHGLPASSRDTEPAGAKP